MGSYDSAKMRYLDRLGSFEEPQGNQWPSNSAVGQVNQTFNICYNRLSIYYDWKQCAARALGPLTSRLLALNPFEVAAPPHPLTLPALPHHGHAGQYRGQWSGRQASVPSHLSTGSLSQPLC